MHNDVTQMFYDTLSAQQTVVVRGRLLGLANDAVETAHQLANVGQADSPDVLQAEVEAEQAAIDYTVAQRVFLQRFKSLAALAGSSSNRSRPPGRGPRRATRDRSGSNRRRDGAAGADRKAGATAGRGCGSEAKGCPA